MLEHRRDVWLTTVTKLQAPVCCSVALRKRLISSSSVNWLVFIAYLNPICPSLLVKQVV